MRNKRWQDWLNLLLGAWLFASPWVMNYAEALPKAAWNAYIMGAAIMLFAVAAMKMPKAWEEALNLLLGAWVAISPWLLGFAASREVMSNAVITGSLVAILALWAMVRDPDFQKWHRSHPA